MTEDELVTAIKSAVDTLNDLQAAAAQSGIEFNIDGIEYAEITGRRHQHFRVEIVKTLWRDGDDYS